MTNDINLRDHISEGFAGVNERLSKIQTEVALAVQKLDNHEDIKKDHEQRLRTLEKWKMKIIGIATGAGATLSYVINKLFGVAG